jgi:hypothetical protein
MSLFERTNSFLLKITFERAVFGKQPIPQKLGEKIKIPKREN